MDTSALCRGNQDQRPCGARDPTDDPATTITALRAALLAAEARFEATFDQVAFGLAQVGLDGRWLRVNPAMCALLGYTPAELRQRTLLQLTHPADREVSQAYLEQLVRGAIPAYRVETRLRHRAGALLWVRLSVTPLQPPAAASPSLLVCVEEITARKEAQHALAAATHFLTATLDYETTLAQIAAAVVPHLADWCCVVIRTPGGTLCRGRMAHVHPRKQALLQELEQRYPLDPAAPAGEPQVLRTGQPELRTRVAVGDLYAAARDAAHLRLLRQLGMRSSLIVPLMAREQTLGALTLVVADSARRYGPADLLAAQEVASRAALAVDNARLFQQAQEAVRVRDDFLVAASHDLRTPLTSIRGYLQVIGMRLESGKETPRTWLTTHVQTLQAAATRMASALEAISDVAQVRIGEELSLHRAVLRLAPLVRAAAAQVAGVRGDEATPVRVRVRAPEVAIWGDQVRLERVLANILGNALTYSPAGTAVQVTVEQEESWAVVRVRDRGRGIPADELPQLFTRYYRASTAQGIKGTGIGLAASKAIVEQHGGTISLTSTVGVGTTVTLRFPRADVPAAPVSP